jgi:hypothetical protein
MHLPDTQNKAVIAFEVHKPEEADFLETCLATSSKCTCDSVIPQEVQVKV